MPTIRYCARLQETLAALGHDPGPLDDDFGPRTAAAYLIAVRDGNLDREHVHAASARDQVAARVPRQAGLLARVDRWLIDDPSRPGYGTWRSEAARAEALRNLVLANIPLLGRLHLHRGAAGPIIAAFGEIELLTSYRPGKASSMCYRRMDRDPKRPWSVHCTGYAVDVDLDRDGRWERVEAFAQSEVIAILESWGLVLGLGWRGKDRDDMHIEWCSHN